MRVTRIPKKKKPVAQYQFGGLGDFFNQFKDINFDDYGSVIKAGETIGSDRSRLAFTNAYAQDNPDLIAKDFINQVGFQQANAEHPQLSNDEIFQQANESAKKHSFLGINKGRRRRYEEARLHEQNAAIQQALPGQTATNVQGINDQFNAFSGLSDLLDSFQFQQGGNPMYTPQGQPRDNRTYQGLYQNTVTDPTMLFEDRYNTKLSGPKEKEFLKWAVDKYNNLDNVRRELGVYDLRGAWNDIQKGKKIEDKDTGHLTDKFKKPNHPTFSDESKYSDAEHTGGTWQEQEGKWIFNPSPYTLDNFGIDYITNYTKEDPNTSVFVGNKKYQQGGPVNPLYVTDPNDPRLRAYQDSLYAYNTTKDIPSLITKQALEIDSLIERDPNAPASARLRGRGGSEDWKEYYKVMEPVQDRQLSDVEKAVKLRDAYVKKTGKTPSELVKVKNYEGYNPNTKKLEGLRDLDVSVFKKPVQPVELKRSIINTQALPSLSINQLTKERPLPDINIENGFYEDGKIIHDWPNVPNLQVVSAKNKKTGQVEPIGIRNSAGETISWKKYKNSPIPKGFQYPEQHQQGGTPHSQVGGNDPLYVTDPNDPRLRAYQDSSLIYQAAERDAKVFNKAKTAEEWVNYLNTFSDSPSEMAAYERLRKLNGEYPRPVDVKERRLPFSDSNFPLEAGNSELYLYKKPIQPVELSMVDNGNIEPSPNKAAYRRRISALPPKRDKVNIQSLPSLSINQLTKERPLPDINVENGFYEDGKVIHDWPNVPNLQVVSAKNKKTGQVEPIGIRNSAGETISWKKYKNSPIPKGFQYPEQHQQGGMSQLGYSDGSPYGNQPFINIGGNNITMANTGKALMAYPNVGQPRLMPPYSGTHLFPGASQVTEVPINQQGGTIPIYQFGGWASAKNRANAGAPSQQPGNGGWLGHIKGMKGIDPGLVNNPQQQGWFNHIKGIKNNQEENNNVYQGIGAGKLGTSGINNVYQGAAHPDVFTQGVVTGMPSIMSGFLGSIPNLGMAGQVQPPITDKYEEMIQLNFKQGGKAKKKKKYNYYQEGGEGVVGAQLENGELFATSDGEIFQTAATELHKDMKKDVVTDILGKGDYVFSDLDRMKMTRKEAEDMSFGMGGMLYEEGKKPEMPVEMTAADIFPEDKDEMKLTDYVSGIMKKFKVRDSEDVFDKKSNAYNKQSRAPYIAAAAHINNKKKKGAKDTGYASTYENMFEQAITKTANPTQTQNSISRDQAEGAPPEFQGGGLSPLGMVLNGIPLVGGIIQGFGALGSARNNRDDIQRGLLNDRGDINTLAGTQSNFSGLSTAAALAGVAGQNPYVEAPQYDTTQLDASIRKVPKNLFDYQASRLSAAAKPYMDQLFQNSGDFSTAVNAYAPMAAGNAASMANIGLNEVNQNIGLENNYRAAKQGYADRQMLGDVQARNQTKSNVNNLVAGASGILSSGIAGQGDIESNRQNALRNNNFQQVANTVNWRNNKNDAWSKIIGNTQTGVNNLTYQGYFDQPYKAPPTPPIPVADNFQPGNGTDEFGLPVSARPPEYQMWQYPDMNGMLQPPFGSQPGFYGGVGVPDPNIGFIIDPVTGQRRWR